MDGRTNGRESRGGVHVLLQLCLVGNVVDHSTPRVLFVERLVDEERGYDRCCRGDMIDVVEEAMAHAAPNVSQWAMREPLIDGQIPKPMHNQPTLQESPSPSPSPSESFSPHRVEQFQPGDTSKT